MQPLGRHLPTLLAAEDALKGNGKVREPVDQQVDSLVSVVRGLLQRMVPPRTPHDHSENLAVACGTVTTFNPKADVDGRENVLEVTKHCPKLPLQVALDRLVLGEPIAVHESHVYVLIGLICCGTVPQRLQMNLSG